jgi:hypothetical protein
MSIDTLVTSAPLVSAPVDSVLPRCLAYTPNHVRQADGSYLIRGLRSGSVVSCANVLELAVCLRLESCGGLRSIVRPDRFASGFSNELRDASRRIASAALTPTFLLQIEAAKRPIVQTVTILAETDACAVDRQATRSAYRSCGMAWTLLTEGWAEWSDAATRLFLTECGRTAPVVAGRAIVVRDAVLRAASDARRDETLADVLIEASLQAGVQPGVAMREYGRLIASGRLPFDFATGSIRTDRPLGTSRTDDGVEGEVADAWRLAFEKERAVGKTS